MKVKNLILRKSGTPKIKRRFWDFSTEDKSSWIVVVDISSGSRKLTKYYSFYRLQDMLTAYMDSIDADENDPDWNLQLVLQTGRHSVLESVLGKDLRITGVPRLEEASKAMQHLFKQMNKVMFNEGRTIFSLFEGEEADSFAKSIGFTWEKFEASLKKDIERFNLKGMILFHDRGLTGEVFAIIASAGILTKFTTAESTAKIIPYDFNRKDFTTKMVSSTFDTCTALFPEMDMVYVYVANGVRNKCLAYTFSELQKKLTKAMDSIGASENNPDRDLLYVLENKRFFILEKVLEPDINKWAPSLKEVSDSLKVLFFRLLDSPALKYEVAESDAVFFAKSVGCTWDEMEESLKRDINKFGLSEAFRFHDSGFAVSVNDKLLKYISA